MTRITRIFTNCLLAIGYLLLAIAPASGALVQFAFTNSVGQPDTNTALAIAVSGPVQDDGSVRTIGIPIRIIPAANGKTTNTLEQNNYLITNKFLGTGYLIRVPNDHGATVYHGWSDPQSDPLGLVISGLNKFVTITYGTNPPPTLDQITNTGILGPLQTTQAVTAVGNPIFQHGSLILSNADAAGFISTQRVVLTGSGASAPVTNGSTITYTISSGTGGSGTNTISAGSARVTVTTNLPNYAVDAAAQTNAAMVDFANLGTNAFPNRGDIATSNTTLRAYADSKTNNPALVWTNNLPGISNGILGIGTNAFDARNAALNATNNPALVWTNNLPAISNGILAIATNAFDPLGESSRSTNGGNLLFTNSLLTLQPASAIGSNLTLTATYSTNLFVEYNNPVAFNTNSITATPNTSSIDIGGDWTNRGNAFINTTNNTYWITNSSGIWSLIINNGSIVIYTNGSGNTLLGRYIPAATITALTATTLRFRTNTFQAKSDVLTDFVSLGTNAFVNPGQATNISANQSLIATNALSTALTARIVSDTNGGNLMFTNSLLTLQPASAVLSNAVTAGFIATSNFTFTGAGVSVTTSGNTNVVTITAGSGSGTGISSNGGTGIGNILTNLYLITVGTITNIFNNYVGGTNNSMGSGTVGSASIIAGGSGHKIGNVSVGLTISGGQSNSINFSSSKLQTIGGGVSNSMGVSFRSTISGGGLNDIMSDSSQGADDAVGGGLNNTIEGGASLSTISGGAVNRISGATGGSIAGGEFNLVSGSFGFASGVSNSVTASNSVALGRNTVVGHVGTFAFTDSSTSQFFLSTSSNQFLVRAIGGFGINTNSPQASLDVNGAVRIVSNLTAQANVSVSSNLTAATAIITSQTNSSFTVTNLLFGGNTYASSSDFIIAVRLDGNGSNRGDYFKLSSTTWTNYKTLSSMVSNNPTVGIYSRNQATAQYTASSTLGPWTVVNGASPAPTSALGYTNNTTGGYLGPDIAGAADATSLFLTNGNFVNSIVSGIFSGNGAGLTNLFLTNSAQLTNYVVLIHIDTSTNEIDVTGPAGVSSTVGAYIYAASDANDVQSFTNSSGFVVLYDPNYSFLPGGNGAAISNTSSHAIVYLAPVDVDLEIFGWTTNGATGTSPAPGGGFAPIYSTNIQSRFNSLGGKIIPETDTNLYVEMWGSDIFGQPGPHTPYRTLGAANSASHAGSTIFMGQGLFDESASPSGIILKQNVNVIGKGRQVTFLLNVGSVTANITLVSGCSVQNLTLTNFYPEFTQNEGAPGRCLLQNVESWQLGSSTLNGSGLVLHSQNGWGSDEVRDCKLVGKGHGIYSETLAMNTNQVLSIYNSDLVAAGNGNESVALGLEGQHSGKVKVFGGSLTVAGTSATNACVLVNNGQSWVDLSGVAMIYTNQANSFAVLYFTTNASQLSAGPTITNGGVRVFGLNFNTNDVRGGVISQVP